MDIRQCARCSKLYHNRGNPQCPECVHEMDEIFQKVRNFLDVNPKVSIDDICEECGAEEEDILRWLREGRLILSQGGSMLLNCQLCRAPIKSGRYCETCSAKVIDQLESSAQQLTNSSKKSEKTHDDRKIHLRIDEARRR